MDDMTEGAVIREISQFEHQVDKLVRKTEKCDIDGDALALAALIGETRNKYTKHVYLQKGTEPRERFAEALHKFNTAMRNANACECKPKDD